MADAPEFITPEPNAEVPLYTGRIRLRQSHLDLEGEGSVRVSWLPHPWVVAELAYAAGDNDPGVRIETAAVTLLDHVSQPTLTGNAAPAGVRYEGEGWTKWVTVRVHIDSAALVDEGRQMSSATAHAVNFPAFAPRGGSEAGSAWAIELHARDWTVIIRAVRDIVTLDRALQTAGGYAITHTVELSKESTFTSEELQSLLETLHYFLTFVRGAWSPPALARGFTKTSEEVWAEWGMFNVTAAPDRSSWFDHLHPEALVDLFPQFVERWSDIGQQRELRVALHWYVQANMNASPESAVILCQVALELLSWTFHFTRERRRWNSVSPASRRLARFLESCSIPTQIPATMGRLFVYAVEKFPSEPEMRTGPIVFTEVRNDIVHPNRPGQDDSDWQLIYEARQLGLWYLELALLRLFDFNGEYVSRPMNRKVVGEVDRVPWANPSLGWPYA